MKDFWKFVGFFYQKRSNGTNSQRSCNPQIAVSPSGLSGEHHLLQLQQLVVSDAIPAPIKTPCFQFLASYTSGANFFLLPPKTIADIGTPSGASASEEYEGYF